MLELLTRIAWGLALPLVLGTGLWLTWRTRGFALRGLGAALRPGAGVQGSGLSPFSCLCTALATTVGTGNIAGAAFALTMGGPGALVWMWISAALGCAVKYAECALAVCSRKADGRGGLIGGPMATLARLNPCLGAVYAGLMAVCALGPSNTVQSSAISSAVLALTGVPPVVTGLVLTVLLLAVLSGGVHSVAGLSTALVPLMCSLYLLGGFSVLLAHPARLLPALGEALRCAFDWHSVGAGAFGHMVQVGVARGCFSNDSGTGSAAFSAAQSAASPTRQGLISASANLWDTGVICTVTALSILVSGAEESGLTGVALTMAAFRTGLGDRGALIVAVCLTLFAFSTLPGLAFQGEQALMWLFPSRRVNQLYRLAFALAAGAGCLLPAEGALLGADLGNALLMLINLPALWLLTPPMDPGER